MILGMKNFNIMGFTEKSDFQEGFTKKQYIGGDCLKSRAWTVCRFERVDLGKKEGGGVFEGGRLILQCSL